MGSLNICRAFAEKEQEISQMLTSRNLDVLFLQEIDLKHFCKGMIHFPGYMCFVNDGPLKRAATLVKEHTFRAVQQIPSPNNLPQVWISVEEYSGRKTTLVNVYREWSTGSGQQKLDLSTLIEAMLEKVGGRLLIGGDFNLDPSRSSDPNYGCKGLLTTLMDEAVAAGMEATPFGPTYHRPNLGRLIESHLDWTLSNFEVLAPEALPLGISDHDLIQWQIQVDQRRGGKRNNGPMIRNLKKIDVGKFALDLAQQPWESLDSLPLEEMAAKLNQLFVEVLDKHAPLSPAHRQKFLQPKPSATLRKLRRLRDNARSRGNIHSLRELRGRCKELAKRESVDFFKQKIEKGGKKTFWNTINKVLGKEKQEAADIVENGVTLSPPQASATFNDFFINKIKNLKAQIQVPPGDTFSGTKRRAERLNILEGSLSLSNIAVTDLATKKIIESMKPSSCPDVYGISPDALKLCPHVVAVPLSRVIQKALEEGKFPKLWKAARVLPTHKKGKKSAVGNYRPISILPSFSKVFETILKNTLTGYLERNNILPDSQFGFRGGLSTQEALIAVEHDLKSAKRNKMSCGALLFDLSAAFDTIDLDILTEKLRIYGADESFLAIVASFLTERSQKVYYQGSESAPISLETGSPQGSILSPILFLTLISDIEEWVSGVSVICYADDTSIFAVAPTKEGVRRLLSQGAEDVLKFMAAMRLVANPAKTNFIMFSKNGEEPILVGHSSIAESKEATLLGVTFNKQLSWVSQSRKVETSLRQKIGLIRRLSKKLPREATIALLEPLFVSNLLHSLPVMVDPSSDNSGMLRTFHGLHRQAMKAALGIPPTEHPDDQHLLTASRQTPISQIISSLTMSLACKSLPKWQHHPLTKTRITDHSRARMTRQNQRYLPPQLVNSTLSNLVEVFDKMPADIREDSNPTRRKVKIRALVKEET